MAGPNLDQPKFGPEKGDQGSDLNEIPSLWLQLCPQSRLPMSRRGSRRDAGSRLRGQSRCQRGYSGKTRPEPKRSSTCTSMRVQCDRSMDEAVAHKFAPPSHPRYLKAMLGSTRLGTREVWPGDWSLPMSDEGWPK